jgi:hypothetical protein
VLGLPFWGRSRVGDSLFSYYLDIDVNGTLSVDEILLDKISCVKVKPEVLKDMGPTFVLCN